MATTLQRIAALEAAVKQLQARVKTLELIVDPPTAATPFTAEYTSEFGGTP